MDNILCSPKTAPLLAGLALLVFFESQFKNMNICHYEHMVFHIFVIIIILR
jgi:hypothetical protein